MNASNNQMHGVFPKFSFSAISFKGSSLPHFRPTGMVLDLSRNKISGSVVFLCQTKEWELIDLSDNLLFDEIPDCFVNFEKLRYLNLANNHFSGMIPRSFGLLSALSLLHLRNNIFSGELPTSMRNCTKLKMIDLGENNLTGKIPAWIGNSFPQLQVLILRSNEFYDNIPSDLCSLAYIHILDLSSNRISGAIPECVDDYVSMTENFYRWFPTGSTTFGFPIEGHAYQLDTSTLESAYFMWKGKEVKYISHLGLVKLIDLSSNNLVGKIPSNITKLVSLVGLNFSRNNLTGPLPPNIGQLKSLNFLDFSRNHLSGSIPSRLSDLSHLGVLNLSYNNLSGRIPQSSQALTFDESSYSGNSGLCGKPLNKSCLENEAHLNPNSSIDVNNVEDESEDDKIITEGFYIAIGLGFIVGFWGIFGTVLLNKELRFVFFKGFDTFIDFAYLRMELGKAYMLRHFQNRLVLIKLSIMLELSFPILIYKLHLYM
ncbi:Non-specific serine/threonine protein kinase [Handroanthus impetiginosus]|uniref:Non-specific serine/threonine protein kinase n=1 Tax=Handroanthus impetiginosus TaxID=429701 RepID=A0A2G9GHL2_9LAMI|nr:Non-specific serine/threonine protein kinase [Handroanthus impetiginosus]